MNEISVLRILYRNRLRLLVIPLAVGVVVGGFSLLARNKYSSTAAITVQRPEVPVTGEISPLRVETLRSLIESTRVKRELFDVLRKEGILDGRIAFAAFQHMLSTRVQYEQGRERVLLPLVKLTVTSSDPSLSKEIANRWAEVVLDVTREIYQSGVDELGTFTDSMYEEVNRSLLESENRYTEVRLEANLEVNRQDLKHNREIYSRLLERTLELEDRAATGAEILRRRDARLNEQEIDGVWIGELFSGDEEADPGYVPPDTPLARRIVRTIRSLARNEEALAEFEEESQIEYKRARVKVLRDQIDQTVREIVEARNQLARVQPNYEKLREELSELDPKIILRKSVGDDLLMESLIRGNNLQIAELPTLESEVSNPVYEEIRAETARLAGRVEGLNSQIEQGRERLEELRSEASDLNREIASLAARQRVYRTAIERDSGLLDYYALSYREDREKYESLEKELELGAAELEAKRSSLEGIAVRVTRLEEQVYAGEDAVARQKRDLDNLSNVRASLASRAEEVALLRVSMENVSRSGTVLLYGAELDPIKVSPRRARTVLISIIFSFLVYSLFLVLREAVSSPEPGVPDKPSA